MIKFRAWDKETNKYFEPTYQAYMGRLEELTIALSGRLQKRTCRGMVGESMFPGRYVVEQFTGLKDVNGRDIYIGDVVKVWSDHSELTMSPTVNEIVSEDLFGRPGVFLKPVGAHLIDPCLHDSWSNQFEVIGNVHENAELLKG